MCGSVWEHLPRSFLRRSPLHISGSLASRPEDRWIERSGVWSLFFHSGSAEHANNLFGAPVGYQKGFCLVDALLDKPNSVVIFDEIDKAHPSILREKLHSALSAGTYGTPRPFLLLLSHKGGRSTCSESESL